VNPAVYLGISGYVKKKFVEKQHSFLVGIIIILFDFEHIFHGSRRRNISNIDMRCCSVQEVNTFFNNVKKKLINCLNCVIYVSHLLGYEHVQKNQKSVIVDRRVIKHYGRRMKLNCRHGYNILILQNGTVSSSDDDIDSHCIMEFTSMSPGHVRIRGVEANLFLAMNKDGLLYGEVGILFNNFI